jgi:hypothetical protein
MKKCDYCNGLVFINSVKGGKFDELLFCSDKCAGSYKIEELGVGVKNTKKEKQKLASAGYIKIGFSILGAALVLFFAWLGPKGEVSIVSAISLGIGIIGLGYFVFGLGIRNRGVPGFLPGQESHHYCPYCNYELPDNALPSPGDNAICPSCKKSFTRKNW